MTAIEWTHRPGTSGEAWNPVTGCTKVSQGCKFCYAERVAERFWWVQYPQVEIKVMTPDGERSDSRPRLFRDVMCHEDRLDLPLKWWKPRTVFVNSMSDLFHDAVPDEFISRVFAVMALCPQHTFVLLTKRAARMREYVREMTADPDAYCHAWARECFDNRGTLDETWPLPNVILGVSVEDQETADARIPLLLQIPAAVRMVSAEPLLGPVVLHVGNWTPPIGGGPRLNVFRPWEPVTHGIIDWLIIGGESGPSARPCDVAWIRALVQQARSAGVACFVKQDAGAKPGRQGRIPDDLWAVKEWPEIARG